MTQQHQIPQPDLPYPGEQQPKRSRLWLWITLGTAVLIVAGLLAWRWPTASEPEQVPKVTASSATPQHSAGELATTIGMGRTVVWTAATDENRLLGRPGGYTSAATIVDSRLPCDNKADPDTSCGATIEVFPDQDQAYARSQYIQSILAGGGILGTEYHTVIGSSLLRVTGQLTPEQAKMYADKFEAAAQK